MDDNSFMIEPYVEKKKKRGKPKGKWKYELGGWTPAVRMSA